MKMMDRVWKTCPSSRRIVQDIFRALTNRKFSIANGAGYVDMSERPGRRLKRMKDWMRRSKSLIIQSKVSVKKRQRVCRRKGKLSDVSDLPADALQCARTMVKEVLKGGAACIKSHGKDDTRGEREEKYFIHLEPDDLLGMLQGFHVSDDGEQYYDAAETDDQTERRLAFKRAAALAVAKQKKKDKAVPLPVAAAQLSPQSQEKSVRSRAVGMNQPFSLEEMMLDTPWCCGKYTAHLHWDRYGADLQKKQLLFASPSGMLRTPSAQKQVPRYDVSTLENSDLDIPGMNFENVADDPKTPIPFAKTRPAEETRTEVVTTKRSGRVIKRAQRLGED